MLLKEEFNNIFKYEYLNSDDLNILIKKYKTSRGEHKLKLRDEVFYNVARFMRKKIGATTSIKPEDRDDAFNSSILDFYTALDKYEIKRGLCFTTYLNFWMMKSITEFIYSNNIVKISRGSFTSLKESTKQKANNGANSSLIYLDKLIQYKDTTRSYQLEDNNSQSQLTAEVEQESFINFVKENLNRTEFIIIKYRYLVSENWDLKDFFSVLHLRRNTVHEIESFALYKLRKIMENKRDLYDFRKKRCARQRYMPSEEELENNHQLVLSRKDRQRICLK